MGSLQAICPAQIIPEKDDNADPSDKEEIIVKHIFFGRNPYLQIFGSVLQLETFYR